MDLSLVIAVWICGAVSGALIVLCWVPEREIERYCEETEHGSKPL